MSDLNFHDWDSYLYKGLNDDVLINIPGIKDNYNLSIYEDTAAQIALGRINSDYSLIPRTYDIEHLQNIHYQLFHETYAWAGHFRTVNMYKNESVFANINGEVHKHLNDAMDLVKSTDWKDPDKNVFASNIANVFCRINYAHPFREGNGRSTRVFLNHVAEMSPFKLEFRGISNDLWIKASAQSFPDRSGEYHDLKLITSVFKSMAKQRNNARQDNSSMNMPHMRDIHLGYHRDNGLER